MVAVTKVQSTFRGHAARNEQQEASRLQWMAYYMQPEVAEWAEAIALTVTEEEEEKVRAAQKGVQFEEEKRLEWFKFYLNEHNYLRAAELVVTPIEAATVLKAKATAEMPICMCCVAGGNNPQVAEGERYERFVQAIRAYEWEVAAALAVSDEEARDVHDSQVRVKALIDATDNGNYQRALEFAITDDERHTLEAAIKAEGTQ